MAHQLRELIVLSRLQGRLSDSDEEVDYSSDREEASRTTRPRVRSRSEGILPLPSLTSTSHGHHGHGATTALLSELSEDGPPSRRDLKTPMPKSDFLDEVLLMIDAEVVSKWLSQAKATIDKLSLFWKSGKLVFDLLHWWLAETSHRTRRTLIDDVASSIRTSLGTALHLGVEDGSVTDNDLVQLMRAVLREYPKRMHSTPDGHSLLLRYAWLLGSSQLLPAQQSLHQEVLSDVRCDSRVKPHIQWLLSARILALATLCHSIVRLFCAEKKLDFDDIMDENAALPSTPDRRLSVRMAFAAIDEESLQVMQFMLGRDGNEPKTSLAQLQAPPLPTRRGVAVVEDTIQDQDGRTLPFYATLHRKHAMLHYLTQVLPRHVFDIAGGSAGNTPLHVAARGDVKATACMLAAAINCNRFNAESKGATPLHVAVVHGQANITKQLLEAGAKVNARMGVPATDTALRLVVNSCEAAGEEATDSLVYQVLLEHGATL